MVILGLLGTVICSSHPSATAACDNAPGDPAFKILWRRKCRIIAAPFIRGSASAARRLRPSFQPEVPHDDDFFPCHRDRRRFAAADGRRIRADGGAGRAQDRSPKADTKAPAEKKEAKPRTAASLECSKEADAKGLHGKERKKFRSECKKAAADKAK